MTHFEKKIEKTILHQTSKLFPVKTSEKGQITKVEDEAYSYWVDGTKVYIFEMNEVHNFLTWYWNNCKETFIFDICTNIDNKVHWKYFCKTVSNFINTYPSIETYNTEVIEHKDLIPIFENLINVNGIDDFITNFISTKNNKLMDFKKTNNTIYKFATNVGSQIFK
jgi:hypothetical protein